MADDSYLVQLTTFLDSAPKDDMALFSAIVNAPFIDPIQATMIDLGIVVLLLVNKSEGCIDRVALSDTEQAQGAIKMSEKPFHHIKIPLNHPDNIISQAIATNTMLSTEDWKYLFIPDLSPEAARFNQAGAGIECSYVCPLSNARDGGALIFSFFQPQNNISQEHLAFMEQYSQLAAKHLR